jgi:hypothetical protein
MKYDPNATQRTLSRRATEAAERQARYVAMILAIEIVGFVTVIILELIR